MDFNKPDRLLEKYFAGDTSLSEEKWLQEYFAGEAITSSGQEYAKELFRYFRQEGDLEEAALEYKEATRPASWFGKASNLRIAGIAAAILILIGTMFFLMKPDEPVVYAYINGVAISDKELAMDETQKALSLISEKLSESTADLSHLSKLNDIKEAFTKHK